MIFYFFPDNLEVLKNIAIFFGALGGVAAFLTLIIKDQFKIKQIDKLSNIALNQEGQIHELKRSVEQLTRIAEYQSKLVGMYGESLDMKKETQKFEQDIEKLKLRPEIKPNGAVNFNIRFKNVGEKAEIISWDFIEGKKVSAIKNLWEGKILQKDEVFSMEITKSKQLEDKSNK